MESIKVQLYCHIPHISQILCGFNELGKSGEYSVVLEDVAEEAQRTYTDMSILKVYYRGKVIIYDMMDGYIGPEMMRDLLENCDFYFKRSFSPEKNEQFGDLKKKMHPLGMNYHVTYGGNPLNDGFIKRFVKLFLRRESFDSFTQKKFEAEPKFKDKDIKILFLTRLWDPKECINEGYIAERNRINEERIALIRALREKYGGNVVAGLNDSPLSRELAPDLIVSKKYTKRKNYLNLMKKSDICIASTGLHGSIGWKTAEYVAASKAIVSEPLNYMVTGNFVPGENYLEFSDTEECMCAIDALVSSSDALYEMKCKNHEYYRRYLAPRELVKKSLETIDGLIEKEAN